MSSHTRDFSKIASEPAMQSRERAEELEEDAKLEQWRAARKVVKYLHNDDAHHGTSLDAMANFVPKSFHRLYEMRNVDTRHMRAVLDYISFLQDPDNTAEAIQCRQRQEPHYKPAVIIALRDAIPARLFMEYDLVKEEVVQDDVGSVILAARSFILELTEGKSGELLTGTKTFKGVTFIKDDTPRSREGSSQSADDFTLAELPPTPNTVLAPDPIALNQPLSAQSTGTTATDLLNSYIKHTDVLASPGRRMSLPVRETQSQRRSLSNERSASVNRGRAPKRTRVGGIVEEESAPQTRNRRGKQNGRRLTTTTTLSYKRIEVKASVADPVLQFNQVIQGLEDEISELRTQHVARDLESTDLNASMTKLKDDIAKQAKDLVEVAYLKEAKKSLIEENARVRDENAVLKALTKAKGVTEEELKEQLGKFTGV